MSVYRIDVLLADGTIGDRHDRIGTLKDAAEAAFRLADDVLNAARPDTCPPQWIRLYVSGELIISINVTTGMSLAGETKVFIGDPKTDRIF